MWGKIFLENRSVFGDDMDKSLRLTFLATLHNITCCVCNIQYTRQCIWLYKHRSCKVLDVLMPSVAKKYYGIA